MQVGEMIATLDLIDITDKDNCPFDHVLEDPPEIKNNLIGKGSTLATNMSKGNSCNLYKPFAPSEPNKIKHGVLPQKDQAHKFFRKSNEGRCINITFKRDATEITKGYPVSCAAHHLVPSQEALKGHKLLEYMCNKRGGAQDHNHGFSGGVVWSDVGYDTNGSENGVYLPGSYAVGGGRGGVHVWQPTGADYKLQEDEDVNDDEPPPKVPKDYYRGFVLTGTRGEINASNKCWEYVAKTMKEAEAQFHDRHVHYSSEVRKALLNIYIKYRKKDVTINEKSCPVCNERQEKIKDMGLPAPYSIVNRLNALSRNLRDILLSSKNRWRTNIYTSEWCNNYMQAVRHGGDAQRHAEFFK